MGRPPSCCGIPCDETLLAYSAIKRNWFSGRLAESIDMPMQNVLITANDFGVDNSEEEVTRRYIRSIDSCVTPANAGGPRMNQNRLEGNVFANARGSEAVRFDQGAHLYATRNVFRANVTTTTIHISGMSQVLIRGNVFEANSGHALVKLVNDATTGETVGNWIVRLDGNVYTLDPAMGVMVTVGGATNVFMSGEKGSGFGENTELTDRPDVLRVTGPVCFSGYRGGQDGGHNRCR